MKITRFRRKKDVEFVLKKGTRLNLGAVSLLVFPNRESKAHRVAVVCPKAVSRRAVDRNRLRRVFFEAAREVLGSLEMPLDVIIRIKSYASLKAAKRQDAEKIVALLTSKSYVSGITR